MSSKVMRDPFRPISAVIVIMIAVFGFWVLVEVVDVVAWEDPAPTMATIGTANCVDSRNDNTLLKITFVKPIHVEGDPLPAQSQVKPGVAALTGTAKVCLQHPTLAQRSAVVLPMLGEHVIDLVLLVLILRSVRTGRRHGLFTLQMSERVRQLGWVALVASLTWPFVASAAKGVVFQTAFVDTSWVDSLRHPDFSWAAMVTALGIITIARALRQAVLLQQDVDETV